MQPLDEEQWKERADFWRKEHARLLKEHNELKKSYKAQLAACYKLAVFYAGKDCPQAKEALRVIALNPL